MSASAWTQWKGPVDGRQQLCLRKLPHLVGSPHRFTHDEVCRECAILSAQLCANSGFFDTSQKCFCAGLVRGKSLVTLLQNEEGIKAVHCSLHDLLHFSLSDVRILRVTVTGGTGLPGWTFSIGPLRNANATSALASRAISGRSSGMLVDFFIGRHSRTDANKFSQREERKPRGFCVRRITGRPNFRSPLLQFNSEQGQMLWSWFRMVSMVSVFPWILDIWGGNG